jgi:16S rRNA G966 N2-methylase RsmD
LSEEAEIVVEHEADNPLDDTGDGLLLYDRRKYGRTALSFYRKKEAGDP